MFSSADSFQTLCQTVRKKYQNNPEVQEDGWPPIRLTLFVNVALLNNEKFPYYDDFARQTVQRTVDDIFERKTSVTFEELFVNVQPGARILIEGRPGSGKTTLMNKVCREWAKDRVLKGVILLLHIPLRRFYKKQSIFFRDIVELLYPGCFDSSAYLQSILTSGEGVCIVLDGIDEYKYSSEDGNFVSELMHGNWLPQAIIIAASRPAASQCFRARATKRAEVLGFLRQQIAEYIKECYRDEEDTSASLLAYLQSHENIHRMCYLPLHLAMVVYLNDRLGGQHKYMPTTETEVYQRFTTYTLLRDEKKLDSLEKLETPEDLKGEKLKIFQDICALAYQQTLNSKPIFTSKDIREVLSKESRIESLGLLTVDKQFIECGVEETYSFLHLTFQEFLSGYYLAQLPGQESLQQFREVGDLPQMKVVWRFFCGISKLKKEHELDMFKLMSSNLYKEHTMQLLHCAYESQNEESTKVLVSATDGLVSIKDETMLPIDCMSLSFVLVNSGEKLCRLELSSCQLDVEEFRILSENTQNLPGLKSLW